MFFVWHISSIWFMYYFFIKFSSRIFLFIIIIIMFEVSKKLRMRHIWIYIQKNSHGTVVQSPFWRQYNCQVTRRNEQLDINQVTRSFKQSSGMFFLEYPSDRFNELKKPALNLKVLNSTPSYIRSISFSEYLVNEEWNSPV